MTNDGGRQDEPTSYELRPPEAPPARPVPDQDGYRPTVALSGGAGGAHGGPQGGSPGASGSPERPEQTGRQDPFVPGPVQSPPQGHPQQTAGSSEGAGRLMGGRYQLLSRLGHGGMGTVWHARDTVVEREVAIKEPRLPDHLSEAERQTAYQRMQREARAAARVDHPSVVTVHDVVVEDGRPWVVMELVRGPSLGDRLSEGTLDPREAARIGLAVVGALQAAHDAGVLHRDVKPDNVLLGRGDRVVLTDFGIAHVEGEQRLTETGVFVGSPEFISPERVLGQRPGPAADLWSLGVVLYAAVEGMSPFRRSHTPATLQAVLSAEPQAPARAAGPLAMLIMQLLRKDPMARPPASEVRQALDLLARSPQESPRPVPDGGPGANRWVPPVLQGNRRAQYGLAAGAVVVALALVLLLANPFGGTGLPKGWETRPERESVRATLAVPEDYVRRPSGSVAGVTFYDPSAVFNVYVERIDNADLDPDVDTIVKPTGAAWKQYYESGGDDGTEIKKGAKVVGSKTTYRDHEAYETTVDFVNYTDSADDAFRFFYHQLVVPDPEDEDVYWRLRVEMPAEGWAHPVGEQLYRDVVAHWDIEGL